MENFLYGLNGFVVMKLRTSAARDQRKVKWFACLIGSPTIYPNIWKGGGQLSKVASLSPDMEREQ